VPSPRARMGRAISAAALVFVAALRARAESGVAAVEAAASSAGGAASAGGSASAGGGDGRAASPLAGDEVLIPVAADARAPATPSTVIDVDRFTGEQTSVAGLLAASPGTTVRALGGPLQTATVSLRGASADESLVLLDGIPLHGPGGGAFDLSAIPASLLSQIVVHRGVLGAQLGAGALGGAIEIVPRGASDETHADVRGSFGSFTTAQVAADVSCGASCGALQGATGAIQLDGTRGDFLYRRSFTPDLPDSPLVQETRENDDARRLGFLLRDEKQVAPGMLLDVIALGSFGDRGLPGPIGSFTPTARADDEGGIAGARLRIAAGPAVVTARAWAEADRIVLSGIGAGFSSCASSSSAADCAPQENHSLSARGEGEVAFPLGGAQWASVAATGGSDWFAGQGEGAHQRGAGSLALRDDVSLLGGKLLLHPAVRLDAIGSDLAASPALGVSLRPFAFGDSTLARALAPLELRASGGTSFRAPTFAELYLDQGGNAPNPALRPERAGSIDAGAAWRSGRLTFAATLFWSRYRDLILYELYPPAREKPFNVGLARILGAELEAMVELPLGFTAEASWSYLDAIDERPAATEDGEKLPYRPPHRLFARLARRGDRLEGFLQADYSSAMPRNQFGTGTLAAQLSLDAGVGARVLGPLWIDLEVKNALDDQTQQDLFLYPLPGVSFTALARARF